MSSRGKREIADEDPPGEDETLEVDPTRSDLLDDQHRVSLDYTGEFATGTVDHDDRGQARWKWNTEDTPSGDAERTFDLLKALNNDALRIEGSPEETPTDEPPRQSGYNPYDVGGGDKKTPKPNPPKPRKK
jgi:hypothetical protein